MSLRTRRTKEEIQRILRQYPTSGLSKRQFCNQYRLSEAALYKWIKI
ncbi:MAG: IS66 family insertion sequence element accessory protein TnpA, partial [Candidatus Fonsibacter sp.]